MTTVLTAMLVSIAVAIVVLALVAIPRVREGEKILTPDGEGAVRDARRRAQALARDARGRAADARTRAVDAGARAMAGRSRPAGSSPAGSSPAAPPVSGRPAASPAPEPEAVVTLPPSSTDAGTGGETEQVVDLREKPGVESAARQRLARALEWGEPEPGPRHRR